MWQNQALGARRKSATMCATEGMVWTPAAFGCSQDTAALQEEDPTEQQWHPHSLAAVKPLQNLAAVQTVHHSRTAAAAFSGPQLCRGDQHAAIPEGSHQYTLRVKTTRSASVGCAELGSLLICMPV